MSGENKSTEQISAEKQIALRVSAVSNALLPFVRSNGYVDQSQWDAVLHDALGVAFWEGAEYQRILMDHVRKVLLDKLKKGKGIHE